MILVQYVCHQNYISPNLLHNSHYSSKKKKEQDEGEKTKEKSTNAFGTSAVPFFFNFGAPSKQSSAPFSVVESKKEEATLAPIPALSTPSAVPIFSFESKALETVKTVKVT